MTLQTEKMAQSSTQFAYQPPTQEKVPNALAFRERKHYPEDAGPGFITSFLFGNLVHIVPGEVLRKQQLLVCNICPGRASASRLAIQI